IAEAREALLKHQVRCAFLTAPPVTDDASLAQACKTVDVAAAVNAVYVRLHATNEASIPWIRRVADYAAERGVKTGAQLHNGTLLDTTERCLKYLPQIGHPNFGLAFEPSHLIIAGQKQHAESEIEKLAKWIVAVSVQNHKPAPDDATGPEILTLNGRKFALCLPGDPDGVDFPSVFRGLRRIGFAGYVTAMPGPYPGMESRELARYYYRFLSGLLG
ncbi:MAG: TIM barrel protein, partial [Armatimonadota bacterium]|nr:TIM barrel protein [Armatimonadota bacterium]